MRVEVAVWAVRPNEPSGFRGRSNIEPYFGIGHSLSLICQPTSEDIKHHFIIIINLAPKHARKHEAHPPRVKKEFRLDSNDFDFI